MGEFEGTATGDIAAPLAGCAFYVVQEGIPLGDKVRDKLSLFLSNGELGKFKHSIGLFYWSSRFPSSPVQVGSPELGNVYGRIKDNSSGILYDFTSGSVTLWKFNNANSTFFADINITATQVGGTATVTITGTFQAQCIDPNVPMLSDEGVADGSYIGPCSPKTSG